MGTVSVIMPTYNNGHFIREALDSALAQTRVPDEIVVVDDGSTDDTAQVVAGVRSDRVRYLFQPNAGLSGARNTGLSQVTGDFVAFLDADDRWRPTMIEKQLAVLESDPRLVYCFTNFTRFEHPGGRVLGEQFKYYDLDAIPSTPGPIEHTFVIDGDAFPQLVRLGIIPAYTQVMLFRRSAIAGMSFVLGLPACEDTEFVLRACMKGPVAYNTESLAEVRRHATNSTRTNVAVVGADEVVMLNALEPWIAGAAHQRAFRDRLVKSHIDGACALWATGESRRALGLFARSFGVPGSFGRKMKGTARFALTMATTRPRAS